jgi:NAD(P)-dependent dehydrogenase (short-subunit alcohol dehydrogenase family)
VRAFTNEYLALNRPLNILVNNAGVMACPLSYTEDGFEMQIGTNHFGHFALTLGLLPALKEGAKQSGRNSRVVNVSSITHIYSDVHLDDINYKNREYSVNKLQYILFCINL